MTLSITRRFLTSLTVVLCAVRLCNDENSVVGVRFDIS